MSKEYSRHRKDEVDSFAPSCARCGKPCVGRVGRGGHAGRLQPSYHIVGGKKFCDDCYAWRFGGPAVQSDVQPGWEHMP